MTSSLKIIKYDKYKEKRHSKEILIKLIDRTYSKKIRKNMSVSRFGKNNAFFLKSHNLEILQKMSNSLKGENYSQFGKFERDYFISKSLYLKI